MAKQKSSKGLGCLAVIILFVAAVYIGSNANRNTSRPPAPPPAEEQTLPGEPFAATGTLAIIPEAPDMPINVWDRPQRSRAVGSLPPGTAVTVTRRYRHEAEDRFYYRVEAQGVTGWVPETLVTVEGTQ